MSESEISFPVVMRFSDALRRIGTIVFSEETIIHGKIIKRGSIMNILGWREIDMVPYLILSKGSWEALVKYDDIHAKFEDCH